MAGRSATEVDKDAALWAVRLECGLTEQEESELEAWLACDKRHPGALARIEALSVRTERAAALGVHFRPEQFRAPRAADPVRRRVLQWSAALGAAAAAGGVWLYETEGRYSTRLGEMRVISLKDRSVVTLNTETSILVHYSGAARFVRLLKGEALFDVAKDAQRPFQVAAADLAVRAVGASFAVRKLAQAAPEVLVREGVVDVARAAARAARPLRLSANMRATAAIGDSMVATAMRPDEIGRELAWRDGRIAFNDRSLSDAAREFARYSDTRIMIDDPALAHESISGQYAANDPVGFSRAVATAFGARVEVSDSEVRLYR
ncbi:MAG TPA: FecR domain-containing protein [Caulobacteraceae bacterium]|nr:FecR domain-containing protein [Caulobacteraceae bacterium]